MKKIIIYFKQHIVRDSVNFLLLFVNFSLLLFLLLNATELWLDIKTEASLKNQYDNQVLAFVGIEDTDGLCDNYADGIFDSLMLYQSHAKLILYLPIGDSTDQYEVSILFSDEEKLAMLQGGVSRVQSGGLFVGELLLQESQTLQNEVGLYLLDEFYTITAVYQNDVSGGYDDRVTVFWNTLSEQSKMEIKKIFNACISNGMSVFIRLDADYSLDADYQQLSNQLAEYGLYSEIQESSRNINYQSWLYQMLNQAGMACIGFFALVNCAVVTGVWMERRKKELCIRKAFGYGMGELFLLLIKDIGICMLCALPFSVILALFYSYVNGDVLLIAQYSVIRYGIIVMGLILIALFATLVPLYKVSHVNPITVLEKR